MFSSVFFDVIIENIMLINKRLLRPITLETLSLTEMSDTKMRLFQALTMVGGAKRNSQNTMDYGLFFWSLLKPNLKLKSWYT
jgi:hypothetical protein